MVNFNAAPNKKAKLVLETSAFKQSRSDLNVAFSTADRDTAILEFIVTQNNKPLLLGNDNVKSSVVFIHSNGLKMKAPMAITDGLNGKISYQVPDDIIATPGKVTAQVYVARKSKKETYAIVAERIFSFEIEKSLAWEFDAETKLNYIVEFDELEAQLKERAYAIEEAIKNAEDYVAKINQARDKGLSDIEIAKTNSLDELNTLATNKLEDIKTKGSQYVEELTDVRNGIDEKVDQFNDDVKTEGYVKENNTRSWQKHKLTNDAGDSIQIEEIDFMNPSETIEKSGVYYVEDSKNGPENENRNGYVFSNVLNDENKYLVFTPVGSYKQYILQKINGEWGPLTDLTRDMETTKGSQDKADESYKKAVNHFDNERKGNYKSLWKGSVVERGALIKINDSYKNYKMLIVIYNVVGHTKNTDILTEDLSGIAIHDFNLSDSDGSGARLFESVLTLENDKQFKVKHNNSYVVSSDTGNSDANVIEYREIVGVK